MIYPVKAFKRLMKRGAGALEITTMGYCAVNCERYCPQDVYSKMFGSPSMAMSLELFKKCIETVPKEVEILFSGFSEPFLNPRCVDMIKHANKIGHPIAVFTTLVGLRREDVSEVVKIPFAFFGLHLPDSQGISHIPLTNEYKDNLVSILTGIPNVSYMSMNANFKTCRREDVCRGKFKIKHYPVQCGILFHNPPQCILLPDGRVALCCADFGLRHIIGNLLYDRWNELAKSPELLRVRHSNRSFTDAYSLCKRCPASKNIVRFYLSLIPIIKRKLLNSGSEKNEASGI